ncbi:BREX system serine/threonine kinase PglW [Actinomarinicola tropica]|uniref:non-specific serine/threonine protein kinase n=1 Tax=Actinomarinicola tropica TaxID=2789776 RepID=A0A5Q2RFA2_9ACTN|nr:BREX system serine/threonine kinase PglW [Actinomarinicola tropica]QGG94363.1 BREX system serine/threonine kinase PglW [Actinomarinicola tropica]
MESNSPRWTTVSDSEHDHEREALAFLRSRLPDRDPIRVWSNFEFITHTGKVYEVDALIVTDAGIFLVEIKSHPGEIGGDPSTWRWQRPDGSVRSLDNPRILANRKAKALKSLLESSPAFARRRRDLPYVQELVFLSDPDLTVSLSPPARHQVLGRDAEEGQELPPQRSAIGGIIEHLLSLDRDRDGYLRRVVDRPLGELIARAVEQVGIREQASRRRIGDYELGDLLEDSAEDAPDAVVYQEFRARHVSSKVERRLRVYPLERNATAEQREAAERAARREWELLSPLDHPGILQPADFTIDDRGPVLFFRYDPDALPLDRWMHQPGIEQSLTLDARLRLVREIAEAVRHANERGVYHRALCPSVVLVSGDAADARVRVTGWHTGARVGTTSASSTVAGTTHPDALAAGGAALYRAPEADQPHADPPALDVFAVGCLAAYIFTGADPVPSTQAMLEQLTSLGHVAIDHVDAIDEALASFVAETTQVDPAERPGSIDDLLWWLDQAEEQMTAPDAPVEPAPLLARKGDRLGGGRFDVLGRLGSGSTSVALLVSDGDADARTCVLKFAKEPAHNERIENEAASLRDLNHPAIVRLLDGPLDLDGHAAVVLDHIGPKLDADQPSRGGRTLAERVSTGVGVELQERFGADLLEAVRHLEHMGIAHRDIKPENLGVAPRGTQAELHLVLFDFSLSRVPLERIDAGTAGYVDPFLHRPGRGRWDPAADRYSAAVVLHEICTGTKPRYGDGAAHPGLVDAPLNLDPDQFEPSVAQGLVDFFSKALAPDVVDRFDTADEMLWAWRQAFHAADQPAGMSLHPDEEPSLPPGASADTPLGGVGLLSNRAVAALEAIDVTTVRDLAALPRNRVTQMRGEGARTRREINDVADLVREHLDELGDLDASDAPLAAVAGRLIPRPTRADSGPSIETLRRLVGLEGDLGVWPSNRELAEAQGVSRQRISQVVAKGRARWVKQPAITVVRSWIAEELDASAGLAGIHQLATRLARVRPAVEAPLDQQEHLRHATAVVRAAVLAESDRGEPRWVVRRVGTGQAVVALVGDDGPEANALGDYAAAVAERTTALLDDEVLVSRVTLLSALREVPLPQGARALTDAHLAELAAELVPDAAVNSRLELYRRGMPASQALAAARRSLAGIDRITPERVRSRVQARFPQAEPLPDRPQLDDLLTGAGIDLRWRDDDGVYRSVAALTQHTSTTSTLTRLPTGAPTTAPVVEIDEAADFEDRLVRSVDSGGVLVLMTDRSSLGRAADGVEHLVSAVVDVDEWLLAEVDRITSDGRPSWETLVAADAAGPGSPPWQNLLRLVDRALDAFTDRLFDTAGSVALVNAGLLARFERMERIAMWRDGLHARRGNLRALWLVVSSSGAISDVPMLDGRRVPTVSPNEYARVPEAWLRNVHRGAVQT